MTGFPFMCRASIESGSSNCARVSWSMYGFSSDWNVTYFADGFGLTSAAMVDARTPSQCTFETVQPVTQWNVGPVRAPG